MKSIRNIMGAALLAGAMLPLSAQAEMPQTVATKTVTVKYLKSAAETPAGAAKLYDSLLVAASRSCRELGARFGGFGEQYNSCVSGAIAKAVAEVNITAVTALHIRDDRHAMPAAVVASR